MLTQREMQNLLDQINQRFDHLSKRLEKLESLQQQTQNKQASPSRQSNKKVVENS